MALRDWVGEEGASHLLNRSSCPEVTLSSCSTIIFVKEALLYTPRVKCTAHSVKTKRVALWVQNAKYIVGAECDKHRGCVSGNDNSATRGSERKLGQRLCSVTEIFKVFI